MSGEKAHTSTPLDVTHLISISRTLAIDGRWSMRANIQPNSMKGWASSQEEGVWNGDTGVL